MIFHKTSSGFYESKRGIIEPNQRDKALCRLKKRFEDDPELCSFLGLNNVQVDPNDQEEFFDTHSQID